MTFELFESEPITTLHFENQAQRRGYRVVAGIDEAGRGPLAGPVVAAAVILPSSFDLPGLTDSKKLSEAARERLFPEIRRQAIAIGVGLGSPSLIDQINILQATLKAMSLAVQRLRTPADFLLVDGNQQVPLPLPQQTLKQGDSRSLSIAAASVVAKVIRDRIMFGLEQRFPGYGFGQHKGYGSRQHLDAIAQLGPSPIHRLSFRGVKEHVRGM